MKAFKHFAVLRYLVRHLDWLAKEGAASENLDADTCAEIRDMMQSEAEKLGEDQSVQPFDFTIDKGAE